MANAAQQQGAAYAALLNAVRQQLQLRSPDHKTPGPGPAWTSEQWWESFNFLFIPHGDPEAAAASHLQNHDDLLFFVHAPGKQQQNAKGGGKPADSLDRNMPFSVRRRSKQLAPEWQKSGSNFSAIAWDETVLLNLVLQTHYTLTATACRQELLPQVAGGAALSDAEATTITRQVFASPVHTFVNLDKPDARAASSSATSCYPDVCFSVDNFDDAFVELVLSRPDDCYCVIMHALLPEPEPGPSHPPPITNGPNGASPSSSHSPASPVKPSRLVLFSGYVLHKQIASHMDSRRSGSARLLTGDAPGSRERVLMSGPGGVGQAEVAVQKLPTEAQQVPGDKQAPRRGLGAVLGALAAVFLEDKAAAGSGGGGQEAQCKLQCAIMSMRLPVDKLAYNLLEASL